LAEDPDTGQGAERLWARPLTKRRYREIVAVPDMRVRAAAVAGDVAAALGANR
jgi:hypothetical protein